MGSGVLVLYDVENIKVPFDSSKYILKKVDLVDISKALKTKYEETMWTNIAYCKAYDSRDHRHEKNEKFFYFLEKSGFEVIKKTAKRMVAPTKIKNKYIDVKFEKGDLDTKIIETLLTDGLTYKYVVLVSGDADMCPALDILQEKGINICVVAHEENMSNKLKKFENYPLHELLSYT